ncbi:ferredoxin reductase family protein [Azohydromonas caseinilytica]|uniref:Ferric reductase n=1 Tax=Azohydromonas caseinilytica TaxID=2728836 RepID=A0A848FA74_9BURK|nr:ferric reductase-like transmembrane domain-containing protein [Azohydromonas caseinilytica]NML15766.1 ferric reductase [Azohydromonas caseinilytica]
MKRIKVALVATLALLGVSWLLADTLWPQPFGYFPFRTVFMQLSGVIAIGAMSVAMLLALRPKWLEPHLDGLDKLYRLHKWLGITALVVSVLHWWVGRGTKWMVGWGWLVRPPRGPRPDPSQLGAIEGWLRGQRGLAESVGEWAFYAAALLMVLALVKRFPYHLFRKTHKWLAVAYLALVYHAAVLVKFSYWRQPVGWLVAALLLGGSVAALRVLAGRVGAGRKVAGVIDALEYHPALRVLESRVALQPGWPGHAAGQFAFATSDPREGAHPYTIASAWNPQERRITFITKALGDHTGRLHERLKVGMPVTVEGPYGCFDFEDGSRRQIWIGAGIGITPFVARMKQLAAQPQALPIDLFHPTAVHEASAIDKLQADARAAGVRLHLLVDAQDGRLDGPRLRATVPDWREASIWFCGPARFGQALRKDLIAHGLPPRQFHQELFQMR